MQIDTRGLHVGCAEHSGMCHPECWPETLYPERRDQISPAADMQQRWRPSSKALAAARAMLAAEPRADMAAIPLVQPGKEYGWWTVGQVVETVEGNMFLGVNSRNDEGRGVMPSWSDARNAAADAASEARGDRPGSIAYVAVYRDGTWAVFEDCL